MATLIEIIIIIIAAPKKKRVLNNLHCSRLDIGTHCKNNCIAARHVWVGQLALLLSLALSVYLSLSLRPPLICPRGCWCTLGCLLLSAECGPITDWLFSTATKPLTHYITDH